MEGCLVPPVIAAIAAIGAIEAVAIGGIVITVGEIAGFVASIAASFALSAVSSAITGKPKNRGTLGSFSDRTQAVRQPITVRRVIYGKVRASGPITFLHSTGNNEYLNVLITLSGHAVEEIGAVYFDDELI